MGETSWKYIPVVNVCLTILLTIGLGALLGHHQVVSIAHVPILTKFVFHVALPCLVTRGIGIGVDFYSEAFIWEYIGAFLLLRAVALGAAVVSVVLERRYNLGGRCVNVAVTSAHERGEADVDEGVGGDGDGKPPAARRTAVGDVVVAWLSLTWISTVILGIPILTAVFGSARLGAFYGLLAGISSFIFQLPVMLALLECHALAAELTATDDMAKDGSMGMVVSSTHGPSSSVSSGGVGVSLLNNDHNTGRGITTDINSGGSSGKTTTPGTTTTRTSAAGDAAILPSPTRSTTTTTTTREERHAGKGQDVLWWQLVSRRDVWTKALSRVVRNPVVWGIVGGFIISLSTLGERYLRRTSGEHVEELDFFDDTLSWLGATTSPVSLFTMGVWMQHKGRGLLSVGAVQISVYMLTKLFLTPLLMVGIAKLVGLDNEGGRAAVLIATLPISLASFSLGEQYKTGEAVLAANVAVGTMLMLPTTVAWAAAMDDARLFVV
eukprot:m.45358 g.45358  ORF g.45358 m.45358 type:complete len:494 (+) comp6642_c0_seq1:72-1553(+)